jgi:hypothetical protein
MAYLEVQLVYQLFMGSAPKLPWTTYMCQRIAIKTGGAKGCRIQTKREEKEKGREFGDFSQFSIAATKLP